MVTRSGVLRQRQRLRPSSRSDDDGEVMMVVVVVVAVVVTLGVLKKWQTRLI